MWGADGEDEKKGRSFGIFDEGEIRARDFAYSARQVFEACVSPTVLGPIFVGFPGRFRTGLTCAAPPALGF